MIYKARKKIGKTGSFIFIVDACYSGTISRGNTADRGARDKLAPRNYNPQIKIPFAQTRISGVFEGTTISIHDIGTVKIKKSNEKAVGYVHKTTEFDAEVIIKSKLSEDELRKSWIFLSYQSFGPLQVNVLLELPERNSAISRLLKDSRLIQTVDKENVYNADAIVKSNKNKHGETILSFILKNEEDIIFKKKENNKVRTIAKAIEKEMIFHSRAKYIRSINLINPDLDVQIEVLPVDYVIKNRRPVVSKIYTEKSKLTKGGQLLFTEGDVIILQVINNGSFTAYFQVIDIQPDNSISMLIPDKKTPASDIKIAPQDTIIFKTQLMQMNKPFGNDMLKIIASREPINNLRSIISNPQARSKIENGARGKVSPLEMLMLTTLNGKGTRGVSPLSIPINEINVYSKIICVVPKSIKN